MLQLQICTPLMITEVLTFFHVYCAILHLLIQSMKIHCLFYRGPSFCDCSVGVLLFWTQALRYMQHLPSSPPCLSLSQRLNEQKLSVLLCSTMCIFSSFWSVLFLLCLNTYSSLPFHFLEPSVLQLDLPIYLELGFVFSGTQWSKTLFIHGFYIVPASINKKTIHLPLALRRHSLNMNKLTLSIHRKNSQRPQVFT